MRAPLVVAWAVVAGCVPHDRTPTIAPSYPTFESLDSDRKPIDPYEASVDPGFAAAAVPARVVGDHVPVAIELGDPRGVETLVVELHVGKYRLPSGANHAVEHRAGGVDRITIRAVPGRAVTPAERKLALAASATADAQAPTIKAAARDAVRGDHSPRERVTSLVHWVNAHITYRLTDEPLASAVLARGSGDCSEMSVLFVAMARAVGIPARRVVGLASAHINEQPVFGFHAWAEVELEGHWVQVDPTWNEELTDAAHITLGEGDSDAWATAVDDLALAIIEVTHSAAAVGSDPHRVAHDLPVYMRLCRGPKCRP